MQLTQWMRRFWDESRNRRARRAAEARSRHHAGEYVSLRLTRLDDRRVFSVASVTAGPDASVSEGAVYALPSSTYTDATAAVSPHTAEVNWGDGSAIQALTVSSEPAALGANGTVAGANHTFVDNGVYNVVVTVRGSDGSTRSDTVQVTVNNVNPIALAGGPYRVAVGGTVQLSGSGLDAGTNDTLTYVWDLNGNGVFGETGVAATRGDETGQTPTFNAAGLTAGTVTPVTLRVIDKDGGNGTQSVNITVNSPPSVTSSGSTNYTENGASVQINSTLTVTDANSDNITGATVTIGSFRAGDVLTWTNNPNIAGNYDANTGILTFTGTRAASEYQTLLRSVRYESTSDDPGTARTISFTASDQFNTSTAGTRSIAITALNDAPTVTTSVGTVTYNEGDPAIEVDDNITVVDPDNATLASATIQISLNYQQGQDLLEYSAGGPFTVNWNSIVGRLTLTSTGAATATDFQAALRAVTYRNTSQNPNTALTRTLTFSVNDGTTNGSATRDLQVTAVNNAPTVTTSGGNTAYTENGAGVAIDGSLTVADADSTNLASATIQITGGYVTGDVLEYSGPNFTASWDLPTQTLTLTPTAPRTVAQYQAALRLVTFRSTSDNPGSGNRTIAFVVDDGTDVSTAATKTVAVTPVNDAPTITGAGQTVGHTEGGADTAVGPLVIVSDADSANLTTATVQIVNFNSTQDVLEYTGGGAFDAVFTGGTLTLTATGAATPADFQAALRSVVYRNTVDAPSTTNRTIRFRVSDGALQSTAVDNTLTITATNDAPTISVPGQQTTGAVQTVTFNTANGNAITVSDPDAGTNSVRVTLTAGTGGPTTGLLTLGSLTGLTFSVGNGINDATMTFTGTIANVNAALNGLRYTPNNRFNGLTGVEITVNDQGNSPGGAPASLSATETAAIDVSPANDPPTITAPATTQTTLEDTPLVFSGATLISVDDEDAGNGNVEVTLAMTLGTLKLSTTAGLNFNQGGDNTSQMRFRGTLAQVNAALDGLRFNPGQNLNGAAVLTITISDLGNTGTGGAQTATATVNIDVTPVNDAPTLNVGAGATSYTEQAAATAVAPALTVGDVDSPNLASATVQITGGYVTGDVLAYSGPNFTATWDEPTRTLTLTPTAPRTVAEYQAALRLVTFANPGDDPGASRTIQFQVTDPDGAVSTLTNAVKTVNITQVNDPPVLPPIADIHVAQGAPIPDIVVTVSDPDTPVANLTLTATTTTNAGLIPLGNITIAANGAQRTISLTPVLNVFGETTITLTLSDGVGGTATRTFTVSVNNPPTISRPADVDTNEDGGDRSVTFTVNDTETPQDNLVVTVVSSSDNLLVPTTGMSFTYNGAGNYTLTMSFGADRNGTSVVRLRVFDGAREAFTEFTVLVRPVNDPPIANDLTVTTDEDTDVTRTLTGSDGDGGIQTLTYRISAGPQNGVITSFNPLTGQFTYRPNANYSGQDTFQFIVTDDGLAGPPAGLDSVTAGTVTITVTPVADDPTITVSSPSATVVGNENTRITSTILVQLADSDGSEELGDIILTGVHPGVRIFAPDGTEFIRTAPDSYTFTPAQFATIRFYAPDDLDTTFTVRTSSKEILRPASTATADRLVRLEVLNTPPVITGFTGTDVDSNSLSTVNGAISDAPLDRFFVTIRWGVSTIGFSQLTSLNNLGPGLATFIASNQFLIAPDPANPAAPISIILDVADDDGGTATQTIIVRVPGTGIPTVNVRESGIQVSQIPIAVYIAPQNTDARPYTVTVQPSGDTGRVIVDRVAVTTRSVLLRVVSARGVESADTFRLGANVLGDIPSFLRKLPDGHYRLYLSENEFTPDRLLIDVVVFRGRAVSLGDMQADRPPLQEVAAVPQRSAPASAPPKNTSAEVRGNNVGDVPAALGTVPMVDAPTVVRPGLSGPGSNVPGFDSGSGVSGEPSR
jgi:hypothetical protein